MFILLDDQLARFPITGTDWCNRSIIDGLSDQTKLLELLDPDCDLVTHLLIHVAVHKREIGKQCRPRSDATERGV